MERVSFVFAKEFSGELMEEAVKFFEDEIFQFELQLKGILDSDYRTYLETKSMYYELAVRAIKNDIERRKQEYYRRLITHDS